MSLPALMTSPSGESCDWPVGHTPSQACCGHQHWLIYITLLVIFNWSMTIDMLAFTVPAWWHCVNSHSQSVDFNYNCPLSLVPCILPLNLYNHNDAKIVAQVIQPITSNALCYWAGCCLITDLHIHINCLHGSLIASNKTHVCGLACTQMPQTFY